MEKESKRTKIVFMGTPEFAVGSLKALVEGGYDVVGVVTVPDKPSGRGLKVNMSAVKEYALGLNVPIMQPVSLKEPAFLEQLESLEADCFVVVAFRMLPQVVWSMPRLGTFNLHASLLPQYRGAAPINWAIINGETRTGVTTFLLDKQIDTGNIIFQQECEIAPQENIGSLYDRLMEIGSSLVLKTVDALARGSVVPKPQVESEVLHPAPKITRETCKIDWNSSATRINNLVRGLSPYPAAYATLVNGEKRVDVKIFEGAVADESGENGEPGAIVIKEKNRLCVKCAQGRYEILELQMAGKKRLKAKEFLVGIHNIENYHFE